jgi:hypothetical protein
MMDSKSTSPMVHSMPPSAPIIPLQAAPPVWDSTSTIPSSSANPVATGDPRVVMEQVPQGVSSASGGDSFIENAAEFFDPTGVLSYDDVYRAYNEYKAGDSGLLNLMVETVGALPVIKQIKYLERVMPTWMWSTGLARPVGNAYNKVAGGIESLYGPTMPAIKAINKGDALQDIYSDNL